MTGFVKIQSSILQSTIWREENHVRILWITMLTLSDKEGVVEGSIPGLADIARITIEECEEGLSRLMSADPYSRTKDYDGKRIGEIDGGWVILNYEKYREPTSKERVARFREKQKQAVKLQDDCANVTLQSVTPVTERYTALPSASVSGSVSSFSLSSDLSQNTKNKVEKDNVKELTSKYLNIFNAVFDRKVGAASLLSAKVGKRLNGGIKPWQILCAPILQAAIDPNTKKIRNFSPEMLLRDGSKSRTGENGIVYGATDWIERIYMQADKARLDYRLSNIAKTFELTDDIRRTGCSICENEN